MLPHELMHRMLLQGGIMISLRKDLEDLGHARRLPGPEPAYVVKHYHLEHAMGLRKMYIEDGVSCRPHDQSLSGPGWSQDLMARYGDALRVCSASDLRGWRIIWRWAMAATKQVVKIFPTDKSEVP